MENARPFLDEDFPGYAEAVARENLVRGAACLGVNEKICGLEVKPLTAYHVRWLVMVRSPFMMRGITLEALATKPDVINDVMKFLWIVSPMFKPGTVERKYMWHQKTERDRFDMFFSPILSQKVDNVCREILEYVDEAYIDAGESDSNDKSYYEFEIAISHELHEHYGYRVDFWNPMPVELNPIHVPLKMIFQFRKLRQKLSDPKAVVVNQSEKFISLGLDRMNKETKLN